MTEGAASPAPAPAASRRKPRRKRNAGKKNESSAQQKGGKGGSSKSGNKKLASGGGSGSNAPPPPPQIKITIRNIQNAQKFGSVKSVLEELVAKLVESCVEKKANNQYSIELDRAAVRHLITEEEKIAEQRENMLREREGKKAEDNEGEDSKESADGNTPSENDGVDEKGTMEETTEKEEDAKGNTIVEDKETAVQSNHDNNDKNDHLDVIVATKTPSGLPTITARPLYVVPPRKTRRRGERGGTAYVLLIGPKIEQKKATVITADKTGEKDQPATSSEIQSEESKEPAVVTDDEDGTIKAEAKAGDITTPTNTAMKATTTVTPEKAISYPRELAKGRLLLSNTLKSLTELVADDSTTQEFAFSGCIVEQSMNGKTWKMFHNSNSRPDRRDGTIEGTADYKDWLERIAKQKEELKARPKPAPGGGVVTSTTAASAGDEAEEDGQLISSLVQHLRTKKQDAKRKKSQKKKKKEDSSKAGKPQAEAGQPENGKKKKKKRNEKKNRKFEKKSDPAAAATAAAAKKAKRKKRERAKKKEKAKAAKDGKDGAAPTALLKSKAAST
mmetsp:Transcript_19679/g.45772  ORF Transcript_19679/g.45772 Transcript_19679/m.45772 type:complete len:560 (+) Transcript_19679:292-1971(+)